MSEVILIDGSSFIYRAYFAIPGFLATTTGIPTKATFGVTQMLLKILKEKNPKYVVWFMDEAVPTFRHEVYKDYKATRPSMPEDLRVQIPYIKKIVSHLGIPIVSAPGFEADDLIATFVVKVTKDVPALIVAGDKDLYPLLEHSVSILDPVREKLMTKEDFLKKYEFEPKYFPHFRALTGDKSDNIPGVPGIGEKTAKKLIKEFKTLENLFSSVDKITNLRIRQNLKKYKDQVFKNLEILKLNTEAPLPSEELEFYQKKEPDYKELRALFKELEFKKLLKEIPASYEEVHIKVVEGEDLPEASKLAVFIEEEKQPGLFTSSQAKVYISSGTEKVFKLDLEQFLKELKSSLVCLFDYKSFYKKFKLKVKNVFDIKLAGYLLNPSLKSYDLDVFVEDELETNLSKKRGEEASALRAYGIYKLSEKFEKRLSEQGLSLWLKKVEIPLSEVLAEMEIAGFMVDIPYLRDLLREYSQRLKELENELFEIAGQRFNPRSSREVADVLFKKLKLPAVKKTPKAGEFSTDAEVLEELALIHPLPRLLLEYRTLYKLKSTYVEPLLRLADSKEHRVHTEFNQTGTATGRLSSKNPNLQNIPIKGEEGLKLRKAFIAPEGWLLCSLDYSQIELRILAHFSEDPNLLKAFERGEDIHTFTACEIFGVSPKEVTPEMRRMSKAINFGIAYGMSAYGLSRELKIGVKEAEAIIKRYFTRYPGIKEYIERCIEFAKENGWVSTISGRRRFVPEVFSSVKTIRELGYRIAVNTPIQGSASDLIKCAMVVLHELLKEYNLKSRLVLQVHDELILEVPEDELETVSKLAKEVMESPFSKLELPYELKVPLKVNVSYGKNWAECK
ncbi:MAG: DNA polymerase I [Thermodesulfobacteria bacterium]|nr:DNA polymerase I [Thermodesulfobacteriota bacterium]